MAYLCINVAGQMAVYMLGACLALSMALSAIFFKDSLVSC